MAFWLMKQEPDCYSFHDLVREGETVWDGVSNPLARKHLRSMSAGDRAFFYHTGKERAIVGIMEIATGPEQKADDPKAVAVRVKPHAVLKRPVTLAEIKADESFAEWELVTQSRLSVMPVSSAIWKKIERLSQRPLG